MEEETRVGTTDCPHSWTCTDALSSPAGVCVPDYVERIATSTPEATASCSYMHFLNCHHNQSRESKSFLRTLLLSQKKPCFNFTSLLYLQPMQILTRQLIPFFPSNSLHKMPLNLRTAVTFVFPLQSSGCRLKSQIPGPGPFCG